ncbi:dynein regulatory complex protein 10-like [Crassostrea angulata]|uniref:dynein regulatory complex protein 10-like n=1 Tax=Magallana angulata TaxID=2784310 RepID=UPI0022B0B2E8|nr:dynein regulatory complex protein 10-like [Crassostrea angulata]
MEQEEDDLEQNEEPSLNRTAELMKENKSMKEKLKQKNKEIEKLNLTIKEQEKEIRNLKKSEVSYLLRLSQEEHRRSIPEDAAGRARAKLLEKPEKKKPVQTSSKLANAQPQTASQKRKIIAKTHWEDKASKFDGKKKPKNDSSEEISEKNCGMVKYREEVYFGQFEKPDRFIFCKSPVAKICLDGNTYEKLETEKTKNLNFRDCKNVSADDIVLKFKGAVDSKGKMKIMLTEEECEMAINTFLNSH